MVLRKRRKAGSPPYQTPTCPDCGRRLRRRGPSTQGVRFECRNRECGVIEVRVHNNRSRVLRVATAEM